MSPAKKSKPEADLQRLAKTLAEEAAPFCSHPFERLRVDCEGNVFMCAIQEKHNIGNLLKQTLEEIWFGDIAEEIRAETLKGNLHAYCREVECPHLTHQDRKKGQPRKTNLPTMLQVDLPNTHCNIGLEHPNEDHPACVMCVRSDPAYRFQTVDHLPELLPGLARLMPGLRGLHVQGVAEAFWKNYFFKALDLLKFDPQREKIRVGTVTNGILLNPARRKEFLERCPFSTVTFSIDAGSSETYRKIRMLDAYDLVIENLMAFAEERKRFPNASLGIHNNINLLNVHEVVEMVRIAARAKVDRLDFSPTIGHPTAIRANEANAEQFKAAQRSIEEEARRLKVRIHFARPLTWTEPYEAL